MRRLILLALFGALGLVAAPVHGEEPRELTPTEQASLTLQRQIRAGDSLEEVMDKARRFFARSDIDGGGISESDQQLQTQIKLAAQRSRQISSWLSKDLDGDGNVTRAELESFFLPKARRPFVSDGIELIPTEAQIAEKLEKLVAGPMKSDLDGDETISRSEIWNEAEAQAESNRRSAVRSVVPQALDSDGDGTVSVGEFLDSVSEVLRDVDLDGDKVVSAAELKELSQANRALQKIARNQERARQEEAKLREAAMACSFPRATEADQVVLLGAYGGQALSTVSLGSENQVVAVADVWIEPGRTPLYILVTASKPMIWRFSGSVERISALVPNSTHDAAEGRPRVGVVGVPAARVHFPARSACLKPFSKPEDRQAKQLVRVLPTLVGRPADVIAAKYDVSGVSVPSGIFDRDAVYDDAVEPPKTGPAAAIWKELLHFNPGGLVEIDPERVVSGLEAKRYSVLPQQAGLAQLLEEGALKVIGTNRVIDLGGTRVVVPDERQIPLGSGDLRSVVKTVPSKFLIVKKIRIPAGLSGAHSVSFVLAEGVPEPEGSAGHSRIRRQGE